MTMTRGISEGSSHAGHAVPTEKKDEEIDDEPSSQ